VAGSTFYNNNGSIGSNMDQALNNRFKHLIRRNLKDIYWKLYGCAIVNPPIPYNPKSFLFVCKGNICRSPFAEHIARKHGEKRLLNPRTFNSAGLNVSKSLPPPAEAVIAARRLGISLDGHKSRRMTEDLAATHDMVIAMQTWHFKVLRESFPRFQHKIFLLPLLDKTNGTARRTYDLYNISDPYGKSVDIFYECFLRIENCMVSLYTEIDRRMAKG
jgi:protein-tyrosine-phosphatase